MSDPDFALTKIGKVAVLSGLTKAMTAFAVLQNVTHKRTMKNMKIKVLWKGLVVEEDTQQALIQYQNTKTDERPEHPDIINELEEILAHTEDTNDNNSLISLASSSDLNKNSMDLALDNFGNPYSMYEITKTTNCTTTTTTRIRPIDLYGHEQPGSKQIVEKMNEDEQESFMAVIDRCSEEDRYINDKSTSFEQHQVIETKGRISTGFKIMLSSVSKKLSRKKMERQIKYGIITKDNTEETIEGPITTMTSTSTTLQSSYSSSSHRDEKSLSTSSQRDEKSLQPVLYSSEKPLPLVPFSQEAEPDQKSKRRMSWSEIKLKTLSKKKNVSSLFQKGAEVLAQQRKKPPPPPVPSPYLHKSNSINSLASLSRTSKTTTYHTPPSSSTSRSLLRSSSVPAKLYQKQKLPLDSEPSSKNFPRKHIVSNISHFIRYASAAYGESFMRILGIGDIPSVLPNSHHPNHHAFAHHTGVSIEDILLSSYTDNTILSSVNHSKLHALVHYVTVDHGTQAIVLTCRGTLGLSDVLTDLTCDYKEFTLPTDQLPHAQNPDNKNQPRHYVAHGGMLEAAQLLATQKGKVFEAIKKGLEAYANYGLVLCGHSLGAGVASLLSVLWSEERVHYLSRNLEGNYKLSSFEASSIQRESCPFVTSELSGLPPGRPIHCYTYGSPCVMSLPLSEYCGQGLVTSTVHAFDIVTSLSLGLLKDFKNIAVSLHEDSHVTDEIMNRVIGKYHKATEEEEEHDQWFWALIKTMRADMRAEKLFPPSTVYLIESVPQLVQHSMEESTSSATTKHKRAHMVQLSRCDDVQARFSEIVFSRTMFMDHSPNMYEKAIKQLNKGLFGKY
ncbi:MAG: lipase family protein [Paenibacillus sp.]|nr:lipase family protein [Paenibacillus sp.]